MRYLAAVVVGALIMVAACARPKPKRLMSEEETTCEQIQKALTPSVTMGEDGRPLIKLPGILYVMVRTRVLDQAVAEGGFIHRRQRYGVIEADKLPEDGKEWKGAERRRD